MQFLDMILASHNWVQLNNIENACSANRKQSKKKIQIKHPLNQLPIPCLHVPITAAPSTFPRCSLDE